MQKEKRNTGISVGSSSILVIFVVLCLTTFAALSMVSANADYKLTQKTAQATSAFYAADAAAEEKLGQVAMVIRGNPQADWQEKLQPLGISLSYVGEKIILSYEVPVDEGKNLCIRLDENLNRLRWQVMPTQEWQGDEAPMGNLLGEGTIIIE